MEYEIKCNAPRFECHRKYDDGRETFAKSDFFSLQSQFEARGYHVSTFFRSQPMRGSMEVEIDGFYYYAELFRTKTF